MKPGNSFPETTSEVTVLQSISLQIHAKLQTVLWRKKATKHSYHDQTLLHQGVSQNLK